MRTYNLLVNADLIDALHPDFQTWYEYARHMHFILKIEYYIASTGGATQGNLINDNKPAHIRDFMQ